MRTKLFCYTILIIVLSPLSASCQYKEELKEIVYHLASPELRGRGTGDIGQKMAAGYLFNYYKNNAVKNFKNSYDSVDYMQHYNLIEFKQNTKVRAIREYDTVKVDDVFAFKSSNYKREIFLNSSTVVYAESDSLLRKFVDTLSFSGNPILILLPNSIYYSYKMHINSEKILLKENEQEPPYYTLNYSYALTLNLLSERFSDIDSRELLILNYDEILNRNIAIELDSKTDKKDIYFIPNLKFSVSGQVNKKIISTENVISVVNGKSDDSPWLIVGAHYDHIGIVGKNINYGADDNASGTAALMVLAKYFSNLDKKLDFNLMFVAFSGEELGLLGSNFFVDSEEMPKNVIGMINMDMIGRPNPDKFKGKYVYVQYGGKGSKFLKKSMKSKKIDGLRITNRIPLYLRMIYKFSSDHYNFYKKDIPIAVLFTGLHNDYHKPKDTPDKIEYDNMENIVIWLTQAIESL